MTFGENLAMIRISRGLTQQELAEMIGSKQPTVSAYEKDQREPSFETCEKIADALNIPISSVMVPKDKTAEQDFVRAVADSMHNDPKRRLLFDLQLSATPEDIDFVNTYLKNIMKERERR